MVSSRAISPFPFKTKMMLNTLCAFSFKTKTTLNNETPKRFALTADDEIINKCLNLFNITIYQCQFVPKCWFNDLTNVTFHKSLNIVIAPHLGHLLHTTQKIQYLLIVMQLHLNTPFKGNQ